MFNSTQRYNYTFNLSSNKTRSRYFFPPRFCWPNQKPHFTRNEYNLYTVHIQCHAMYLGASITLCIEWLPYKTAWNRVLFSSLSSDSKSF